MPKESHFRDDHGPALTKGQPTTLEPLRESGEEGKTWLEELIRHVKADKPLNEFDLKHPFDCSRRKK